MSLAAQTRLGPYEITALLGAGATGEVYKAIDTRLNRTVAIKLLKGPDVGRFVREAQIIASLNNPHICAIHDIGDDYIVMEYVEGAPLEGPLPVEESLHLAAQIADALEAAHSQGIVHRDLKPANILVSHGNVKLLDFGHAKQLSSSSAADADPMTLEGTLLGTAAYMSPEQAQGKPADPRSDIFAFGVVLYEMLSGRRPFTGDTTLNVLNNIVHSEPRPLETTPELQRIVTRCLRKDPADRFQSMTEVREALAQVPIARFEEKPSIAVLPFANLSGDPENEYFSDGLTDEIINALSQIPGLRVTARTSAFVFRKREEDIRKIAEVLGVQTILEGSVRQSGTRLRVIAQLINAAGGYHLWSRSYDREKDEVFAIQDDIAGAIAKALQLRLYHGPTGSIRAYEAYLKAQYYVWKMTPESLARSRECYEEAIALDQEFALAYSGYAMCFLRRTFLNMIPAQEAMPAARLNARKALELDASLPEPHAVLATVAAVYDHDRHEVERQFELAVAHEAVSSMVRILHAWYYHLPRGQVKEAVKDLEQGLRDDPLNALLHYSLGVCLFQTGGNAEASREFQEALELDEHAVWAMAMLALDYWSRGMQAEALAWAERVHSLSPGDTMPIGLFAGMLAWSGNRASAEKVVEKLGDGQAFGAPFGLVFFHLLTGDIEKALHWLKIVVQERYGVSQLLFSPLGKSLSSSPQWPAVAKSLNLYETILPAPDGSAG